jgi:hypothetical protein
MVDSEELIGTTEYLTLYARCRINRCRYKRVRLYFIIAYAQKLKQRAIFSASIQTGLENFFGITGLKLRKYLFTRTIQESNP